MASCSAVAPAASLMPGTRPANPKLLPSAHSSSILCSMASLTPAHKHDRQSLAVPRHHSVWHNFAVARCHCSHALARPASHFLDTHPPQDLSQDSSCFSPHVKVRQEHRRCQQSHPAVHSLSLELATPAGKPIGHRLDCESCQHTPCISHAHHNEQGQHVSRQAYCITGK